MIGSPVNSQSAACRDVKSNNILLTKHGIAKVADVGMASMIDYVSSSDSAYGSYAYAAPECIMAGACTTKASPTSRWSSPRPANGGKPEPLCTCHRSHCRRWGRRTATAQEDSLRCTPACEAESVLFFGTVRPRILRPKPRNQIGASSWGPFTESLRAYPPKTLKPSSSGRRWMCTATGFSSGSW